MSGPAIEHFDFNDCEFVTDASEAQRYQQALLVKIQNSAPSVVRELWEMTRLYNPHEDDDEKAYCERTVEWVRKYGLTDREGLIPQWVHRVLAEALTRYWEGFTELSVGRFPPLIDLSRLELPFSLLIDPPWNPQQPSNDWVTIAYGRIETMKEVCELAIEAAQGELPREQADGFVMAQIIRAGLEREEYDLWDPQAFQPSTGDKDDQLIKAYTDFFITDECRECPLPVKKAIEMLISIHCATKMRDQAEQLKITGGIMAPLMRNQEENRPQFEEFASRDMPPAGQIIILDRRLQSPIALPRPPEGFPVWHADLQSKANYRTVIELLEDQIQAMAGNTLEAYLCKVSKYHGVNGFRPITPEPDLSRRLDWVVEAHIFGNPYEDVAKAAGDAHLDPSQIKRAVLRLLKKLNLGPRNEPRIESYSNEGEDLGTVGRSEAEETCARPQAQAKTRPGPARKLANVSRDDLVGLVGTLYEESARRNEGPPGLIEAAAEYQVDRRTLERYITDVLETDWKTIRAEGELAARTKS